MYCNNCGKFLLENDKFCSNCGARVFQNEQDSVKAAPPAEANADSPENQTPKPTPPLDNIKWNIEDFPGHDVKKTEEINFDWGNTSVFKKPEPTVEEIAFNPVHKEDEPKEADQEADQKEEKIIQGKDLEEEIFAEASLVESISSGTDSHRRTKIVDKFYTFNKKNEEFQKLLDQEYEKIKEGINDVLDDQTFRDQVSEINQKSEELWPEFNPTEHIAEMALARERFFGTMTGMAPPDEPKYTEKPKPAQEPVTAETSEPEATQEPPETTESEAVPEPAEAEEAAETPSPESDELPGEEPLPEENILPDLEICNEEQTMHRSEPLTEPEPEFVPQVATPEEKDSDAAAGLVEEPPTSQTMATALDDKLVPEDFDDVNSIRDKWIKYEEDEDDEDEGKSGGKVGKFIIGFLVLLLLVQLALLGVKLVAPESAVAQFVDEKVQQVILFFQGSDNVSQALVTDRTIAAEDKTGLIQTQIDKNYNGNIAVIKYNGELRLNTAKKYSDTSLNQSIVLQDNEWYTKDDGTVVYYDEQAIGAIISYESTRRLADGEAFATLEIGEIRINGEDLFVWVAEEITPGDRQEKIFRIAVSGETMNVNTEYDV
jgi:hypothetical protein